MIRVCASSLFVIGESMQTFYSSPVQISLRVCLKIFRLPLLYLYIIRIPEINALIFIFEHKELVESCFCFYSLVDGSAWIIYVFLFGVVSVLSVCICISFVCTEEDIIGCNTILPITQKIKIHSDKIKVHLSESHKFAIVSKLVSESIKLEYMLILDESGTHYPTPELSENFELVYLWEFSGKW